MEAISANRLGDVRALALQACVIGIDEGQFVSESILHAPDQNVSLCTAFELNLCLFCFFHSFLTQWTSVRKWPILGRQSLLLPWMEPSRER